MIASLQLVGVRILTGLHAGAEISLAHGTHEIGSDLSCTIVISDWPVPRSLFTIEKNQAGALQVRFADAALAAPFGPHKPARFGDIVIVAFMPGEETQRPSDLALLTNLLAPAVVVAAKKSRSALSWVVGGMLVAVGIAVSVVVQSPRSVAATHARSVPMTTFEQVKEAVAKLRYAGVYAAMDGDRIVIAGIVRNRSEAKTLAAELAALQVRGIEQRYAVESEIAAAISDAIARPGVTVKHLGSGRFEIRGEIPPSVMQKIDLKRLKNDLGSVVSSITFQEPAGSTAAAEDSSNMQHKNEYQFKQGSDGTKYFKSE